MCFLPLLLGSRASRRFSFGVLLLRYTSLKLIDEEYEFRPAKGIISDMKDKEVIKDAFKDAIVEITNEFTDGLADLLEFAAKWVWRALLALLALIGLLVVAGSFMQPIH